MKSTFTITGRIYGYRQGRRAAFHPPRRKFKEAIRLSANVYKVPLSVLEENEATLHTEIYWKKKARIDGKNVYSIVEDALWKQDLGVKAGSWSRRLGTGEEKIVVTVEWREGK